MHLPQSPQEVQRVLHPILDCVAKQTSTTNGLYLRDKSNDVSEIKDKVRCSQKVGQEEDHFSGALLGKWLNPRHDVEERGLNGVDCHGLLSMSNWTSIVDTNLSKRLCQQSVRLV